MSTGAYQAFIELGFQGRLAKADELLRAEVSLFRSLVEDYGLDATSVPKYAITGSISYGAYGQETFRAVELKLRGAWSLLIVETRAPNVFVIHDRQP